MRRDGRVPAVIYGDSKEPLAISLDFKDLRQKIYAGHFLTTVFNLDVDGTKHRVIPRDFQLDPVMDNPTHVDFLRLGEGAKVRVRVPVRVINADAAPGIKRGGTVNIVSHTISVQVPADNIPQAFEVDLTGLEINYSRHLSEIQLPPDVKVLEHGDVTLVTIVPPSGYAEEMKAPAEAAAAAAAAAATAAEAGAAPAEGAPAAAPGAAAPAAAAPAEKK